MDKKNKSYSPEEVAVIILEKVKNLYKSSTLAKNNTAHEIEGGSEPVNNDAECPEYLEDKGNVGEFAKKKNRSACNQKNDNQND